MHGENHRSTATERLYYHDSELLEFDAAVVEQTEEDGRWATVLDRTAFYPTSGGQPHDTGSINGVDIIDVIEAEGDRIVHISHRPVASPRESVHGVIDRDRRRQHRQLHTAQHVLSQAFIRLFQFETVSVHLGQDYGAIELNTDKVTDEQLQQAEQLAREVVESCHSVETLFVAADEAESLPLRRVPTRSGTIRVVRIDDFDWSACGGTHCTNTGQVGLLKVTGVEKIRGRALVKFLAGGQAWDDYRARFEVTSQLTRRFTCHVTDLPDKADKLSAEIGELKKEVTRLQKELLPMSVNELANTAEQCGKHRLCMGRSELTDDRLARQLASETAARIGGVVLLAVSNRLLLAVAPDSDFDANSLVRQLCHVCQLKGGGGKTLAQIGNVPDNALPQVREVLTELLQHA